MFESLASLIEGGGQLAVEGFKIHHLSKAIIEKSSAADLAALLNLFAVYYFTASSTATAQATVIPTMGLLPAPSRPIIST